MKKLGSQGYIPLPTRYERERSQHEARRGNTGSQWPRWLSGRSVVLVRGRYMPRRVLRQIETTDVLVRPRAAFGE